MGGLVEIVSEIRLQLLLGVSLSQALETVLAPRDDFFAQALRIWQKRYQAGQKTEAIGKSLPHLLSTSPRKTLVSVLERGLGGSPVDAYLLELELEFTDKLESAFEKKMQLLPLKLLIPLTIFILPAVITLIVGPLFLTLVTQM